ncbi:MAG: hypothetical protein IJF37_04890 [Lachnospiraceae bacterium]|nr:hypothetical protein [Lachnospiraceae bacterium]
MEKYKKFREEYPQFVYNGYTIKEDEDNIGIEYHFEVPGLSVFNPSWVFPKKSPYSKTKKFAQKKKFKEMVYSLGLVELVSYWKIACPPEVVIRCGNLDNNQKAWWKSLYFNGLGEFYYTNGIEENEVDFMDIVIEENSDDTISNAKKENMMSSENNDNGNDSHLKGCLVPIGGGKDSALSLSILKDEKETNYCYIINPRGATIETYKAAGYDEEKVIAAKRTLDKNMLELNKQGFLNGHTPFSAIVSFSATIAAYINGIKYIVLSNESSANESTVEGSYVNHQYSKSFKYEKDFHEYEKKYIGSGTYYFSLLRPMSEFQIAEHFAKCTEYHDIFRSCNVGSKEDIWCGHCPKCLFVWLILSPFLSQKRLTEIFGRNMADDREMELYFSQLIGMEKEKPFECVGSRDEINAAVTITIRDFEEGINCGAKLSYLLERYKELGMYEKHLDGCEAYFEFYDNEHLIPEKYLQKLKEHGIKVE